MFCNVLHLQCFAVATGASNQPSGMVGVTLSDTVALRTKALTMLGATAGGDPFVLARIAGHSSITITQRYIHPQQEAVQRVFTASQPPR